MTADDLPEFLARLTTLAELFDAKLSEAKQQIYFETLCDLELVPLREGMLSAARLSKFMPKPVEIREHTCGSIELLAEAAWLSFRDAMRRVGSRGIWESPGPNADVAVNSVFGSFNRACLLEDMTEPMWQAKKKEFMRVFDDCERADIAMRADQARLTLSGAFRKLLAP